MNTARILVEGDSYGIHGFLLKYDYPYADVWALDVLDRCLRVSLRAAGKVIGYVWFHNTLSPGTMEMHLCINPRFQKRWMAPRLIRDLFLVAHFCGADKLSAQIHCAAHKVLLRRMGWSVSDGYAEILIPNKWTENGQ